MQKLWHEHYDGDQLNTTQENLLARADVYNIKELKKIFMKILTSLRNLHAHSNILGKLTLMMKTLNSLRKLDQVYFA